MDREALQKLTEQAKRDPKFLHALVFEPKKALDQCDYLDRATKTRLLSSKSDQVFASIARSGDDNAP